MFGPSSALFKPPYREEAKFVFVGPRMMLLSMREKEP